MDQTRKTQLYQEAAQEICRRCQDTSQVTARLATVAAVLKKRFDHYFWVGFYLLVDGQLTVGPYQGPPACLVLEKNKGVCWASIDRAEAVVVPNVHEFRGHIACDGRANSEISLPLRDRSGQIVGVFDVDSGDFDSFDSVDVENLERILSFIFA